MQAKERAAMEQQGTSSTQKGDGADFGDWMKSVWQVVSGIPRGHVLTYGEVARLAGKSRWARRVSRAMRRAPRGVELPWHRVVNARGEVSRRSDGSGIAEGDQRHLLAEEGVEFDSQGRIDLDRYSWEPPAVREEVRCLIEPGNR